MLVTNSTSAWCCWCWLLFCHKDERKPCPRFKSNLDRGHCQEAGIARPGAVWSCHVIVWWEFKFLIKAWPLMHIGVFPAFKWSGAYRGRGACYSRHKVGSQQILPRTIISEQKQEIGELWKCLSKIYIANFPLYWCYIWPWSDDKTHKCQFVPKCSIFCL